MAGLAVVLLTSCGNKKTNLTPQSSSVVISSQQALANCNRLTDSNMSYNVSVVKDANNEVSANWIKVKFNFLSSDLTQSSYLIRFYK